MKAIFSNDRFGFNRPVILRPFPTCATVLFTVDVISVIKNDKSLQQTPKGLDLETMPSQG